MSKDTVEIFPAFVDDCRKADDFRPCADDNKQFQFSVILKSCHGWLFYRIEIGVGTVGVKDFVGPHYGHEIVGIAEVDDIVGISRQHVHRMDILA